MVLILIWVLIAYGLTSILVWGSIFEKVRMWIKSKSTFFGDLISCTLCTSTWVGFFMSFVLGSITSSVFEIPWYISAGSQSIADNRNSIISYWKSERMLNTTKQTITVHYGVLFVGAKLIVIFFNSNVMNDRTVLAMNKTVE